jgi:alanine racemase
MVQFRVLVVMKIPRPVWAEIDLDCLAHNLREVRRLTDPDTMIMAVVKADAYGHGAVASSRVFLENGARRLAVATLTEAMELRREGVDVPILILGYTPSSHSKEVVEHDITPTVYTLDHAKALSKEASSSGKVAKVHIKLDTGLRRIGYLPSEDSIGEIEEISRLPSLEIEGIFTHFAKAGDLDKTYTRDQFEKFRIVSEGLEDKGVDIPLKHVANSAAITDLPEYNLDMVRPGGILYGLHHSDVLGDGVQLRRAMTLKASVSNIKTVPEGTGISYGLTYTTERRSVIGTLPVGYADGYNRALSSKGEVGIRGERAPVIGRICMDQCMIDLTDIEGVEIGDEVILFGNGGDNAPMAEDVARWMGSNVDEVVSTVGRRIPRVYVRDGEIVDVRNYLSG